MLWLTVLPGNLFNCNHCQQLCCLGTHLQCWPPELETSATILTNKSKANPHQNASSFIQLVICEYQFCKSESDWWCWSQPSGKLAGELSFSSSILGKWALNPFSNFDPFWPGSKWPSYIKGVPKVLASQKTWQISSIPVTNVLIYIIGQSFLLHRIVIRIKEGNLGETA